MPGQSSRWLASAVILCRLTLSNEEFPSLGSVTKTLFLFKTSFLESQTQMPEFLITDEILHRSSLNIHTVTGCFERQIFDIKVLHFQH